MCHCVHGLLVLFAVCIVYACLCARVLMLYVLGRTKAGDMYILCQEYCVIKLAISWQYLEICLLDLSL